MGNKIPCFFDETKSEKTKPKANSKIPYSPGTYQEKSSQQKSNINNTKPKVQKKEEIPLSSGTYQNRNKTQLEEKKIEENNIYPSSQQNKKNVQEEKEKVEENDDLKKNLVKKNIDVAIENELEKKKKEKEEKEKKKEKSLEFKQFGNKHFLQKEYEKAIDQYTQAIVLNMNFFKNFKLEIRSYTNAAFIFPIELYVIKI